MKILLIVPAYNEEQCILPVCNKIKQHNLDYIVINDASTDDTEKILQENNLNHITLSKNLGIGGAVQTGYLYALQNGYDVAVQFDGDGQHDINYVQAICEPIIQGRANICIGSRYLDEHTSNFKSTVFRRTGGKIIAKTINALYKVNLTDVTSGFRAIDRSAMKLFCDRYSIEYPEPDSIVYAIKNGLKVNELSVNMNERIGGKSSIKIGKCGYYMANVLFKIIIDYIA